MFDVSPIVLGIILFFLGLGFVLLTFLLLRLVPRLKLLMPASQTPLPQIQLPSHSEAVLLVRPGGRISYLNRQARDLFNSWEEEPNLESLARRARPSEAFISLCASEGQTRFSLNGKFVEGTSYFMPNATNNGAGQENAILVSIRRPQFVIDNGSPESDEQGSRTVDPSAQTFVIFTELSQAMAASLELEPALQAILESVERLIPSDFFEIAIWDEENQVLVPYRLVGLAGVDRHIERSTDRYQVEQGYSGYLYNTRQPLLVKDINAFREVRPVLDRQRFPFQSYLGVPLLIAGDMIGTLELASLSKENYSENDLEILRVISGQASVALHNALLYRQEQQRAVEMAGLANLVQAVGALRDPQDLFARLVESIASLLNVEILGFLLFDESRHLLQAQNPFQGIPPNVTEMYQAYIEPDSPGEEIWRSGESITATNAAEDTRLKALGIHHVALAAGIVQTVLVPLGAGGRALGYLQAADKRDGSSFDQDDLRLLAIVAGQSASIIENAKLVQDSRRRTQRAETLRRIASLTSSSATLDEILKFSVLDLARLMQADMAAIFLLDENRGELRLHKPSTFGIPPEISADLGRLPIDDPQFPLTVTGSKQQFTSADLGEEESILPLYRPLVERLEIHSAIAMPLIMRERGIGELMIGSLKSNFFMRGDTMTVATAAGQLAAAIEQSTLYSMTDHTLRQRVDQLTALTRISRELNTTILLEHLLQRVYDESLRTTRADCGTILLFNISLARAETSGASDESFEAQRLNKPMIHIGDEPGPELLPLEKAVLHTGETLIISDFELGQDIILQDKANGPEINPEIITALGSRGCYPAHDGIRSALLIPIAYQGQVAGLIHMHAKAPNRFGETEREIAESLAIQAAIALGNAHRYQEQKKRTELLNRRVETLSKLFEVSQILQGEQPLEDALEAIAYAIQASTPFDIVLISIYEAQTGLLKRITATGIPLATLAELRQRSQPWEAIQPLLQPEFRLGHSYYVPHDRVPSVPDEMHSVTLLARSEDELNQENQWHPEDFLMVPLFSAKGEPLGLISVDAPRNNQRPDRPTIETLEIFSSQAALIVENQQKLTELKNQAQKIQDELEVAQAAAQQAQQHLPALLHKDVEQTLAVQRLSQRARRIYAGLDLAEIIGQQTDRQEVLKVIGQEFVSRMDFEIALIAEATPGGQRLIFTAGSIPEGVTPVSLLGQRNPLRHSLQNGETMFVSNLEENAEWQNTPLLRALEAKSFVCLPILSAAVQTKTNKTPPQASVLAVSRMPVAAFTTEDEQLFNLLARQVSLALQNIGLLEEATRRLNEVNLLLDFSRQLGGLDPAGILNTLVESVLHVVPSAQAAMTALWDAQRGLLVPQAASGYTDNKGILQVLYKPGEGLPGQVFEQQRALLLDEVDFAKHYNLSPNNLLRYRNATGGRLPVSSMVIPLMPRVGQKAQKNGNGKSEPAARHDSMPLGVLILDNSITTSAFTNEDLALITSLVQQTALTLENARLYLAAERRSEQLQALTGVATAITSSLQTEDLVSSLLDQLQAILPYDTGTLWLRERSGQSTAGKGKLVVQAARGFSDSEERIGLAVNVEDSVLLNEMINTSHPIWVANVLEDERFHRFSMEGMEGETGETNTGAAYEFLSWLGVPLIASGEVIGVIALEKAEANYYSQDDIQVATTYASQAAVGLENANLYQQSVSRTQELDQQSQTLTALNRLSSELSVSLNAENILNIAIRELSAIIPCTTVTALVYLDESSEISFEKPEAGRTNGASQTERTLMLQAEYSRTALPDFATPYVPGDILPDTPLFKRLSETLGIFNTGDVDQEAELEPLEDYLIYHNTHSLLIIPIASGVTTSNEIMPEHHLHGLLLAHNSDLYRFGADDVELARTISNQVAIALQNARLFDETRNLTAELEMRVLQRTKELEREHKRSETLLRVITELSASLDLDQVLNSTLQVLMEYVKANQITILIARPGERQLQRLASIGHTTDIPKDGAPTPFMIDQGLAGWIISQRQSVLIDDVQKDERWIKLNYPEDNVPDGAPDNISPDPYKTKRSTMGVPLMSGTEAIGTLLLFHHEIGHFSVDQLELVQAAANQVGVAVNNAELYRLIRDQAENLGNMLRSQQIETSRSTAILEAVADGVLVTDSSKRITLFNESAEHIMELQRSQVVGKSLESFSGFFGRAGQSWMETIGNWSRDPETIKSGELYAERVTLEDGRVISVHLSPVSLRNDFLGTVSIFRDITHQVEVDRLKSEFVATVSHELRTPMTSIKGYVDIMLMGATGPLSPQQSQFLQVVKSNTERLTVLVNDLLDISQIEAGKTALSMQPLDIAEIADQAIEDILHRAQDEQKPINVEKDFQPALPLVMADRERLRQIFSNLLDNAYQYNEPNGKIILKINQENGEVQVAIKDTGMGIHPSEQSQVFERFFRGENPLMLGVAGTGLGLSITKYMVEVHNGRIWFTSNGIPGEGTTFFFTIPQYQSNTGEALDHPHPDKEQGTPFPAAENAAPD